MTDLPSAPRPLAPATDSPARTAERLQWLARTQDDLARTIKQAPWLALSALAAVPAGLLGGAFAAAAVAGLGLLLPVVTFYLSWCHQQEYAAEEATIRRNLAVSADPAPAPTARPWRVPGKLTRLF